MDVPIFGPLFAVFGRVWTAIRQNPCTIEKLDDPADAPRLKFRVRNDSQRPVVIERLGFDWKLEGENDFNVSQMPMDTLLNPVASKTYGPGESFEVAVTPSMVEGVPVEVRLTLFHNQAPRPAAKRAKVKRDAETRQWVCG